MDREAWRTTVHEVAVRQDLVTKNNNNGVVNTVPAEETETNQVGKRLPSGRSGSDGGVDIIPAAAQCAQLPVESDVGVRRGRNNSRQVLRGRSGERALSSKALKE